MREQTRKERRRWTPVTGQSRPTGSAGLTRGEVDVSEEDDVGGDEGDELRDANLLLEMDVNHVVVSQAAVGRRVELLQTGAQAAQEPGRSRKKQRSEPSNRFMVCKNKN